MSEALHQIQSDIKPNMGDRNSNKYRVTNEGSKERIINSEKSNKNQQMSKSQRKKEKAKRFFDNL